MIRVVKFGECKESVAVLKFLLGKAIAGKLRGLALCYRRAGGPDEVMFTGVYRASAEAAMLAGVRIKREAAHQLELFDQ